MKKFFFGQRYEHFCWFTGARMFYKVEWAEGGKVKFSVVDNENDGIHQRDEEFDIRKKENGDEYVVLFTYRGEECRIEAEGEIGVNDEFFEDFDDYYEDEKDYGPSNPWDAPGMKISDFITGVSYF